MTAAALATSKPKSDVSLVNNVCKHSRVAVAAQLAEQNKSSHHKQHLLLLKITKKRTGMAH